MEPGLAALAALLLITAAQAALPAQVMLTSAPRPAKPVTVAPALKAEAPVVLLAFAQPVAGYPVVSPFGLRQLPWEAHGRLHEGIDIAAPIGAPIRVTADGVVTAAGESASYGRFVQVTHAEGMVSFYAHMGTIDPTVAAGVALKSGALLGTIGNSGTSTGPHLHFEIRDRKERPLNPQAFLGRSFASVEELPIQQAARFSRHVRLAQVSRIPDSKRELMAKLEAGPNGQIDSKLEKTETWMGARLEKRDRVRAQVRMIAESQHRQAAPSAGDAAVPANAVAPLNISPPPLDLNG